MKIEKLIEWQKLKEIYEKYEPPFTTFKFDNSIAIIYHENSKLDELSARILGMRVESLRNEFFLERASQPFKIYPSTQIIQFEENEDPFIEDNLLKVIKNRKSIRKFKKYKISLKELYYILHYSYGITRSAPIYGLQKGKWYYRMVPSAGALYPLEIYIVILNGEIKKGLYHYRPDKNCLEKIKTGSFVNTLNGIIFAEPNVKLFDASIIIIITAIFERVLIKYGDRGYRFILMETGFVSQNISLICEALGLGSCMIGGYLDDEVNKFLEVDGLTESALNIIIIGKPDDRN